MNGIGRFAKKPVKSGDKCDVAVLDETDPACSTVTGASHPTTPFMLDDISGGWSGSFDFGGDFFATDSATVSASEVRIAKQNHSGLTPVPPISQQQSRIVNKVENGTFPFSRKAHQSNIEGLLPSPFPKMAPLTEKVEGSHDSNATMIEKEINVTGSQASLAADSAFAFKSPVSLTIQVPNSVAYGAQQDSLVVNHNSSAVICPPPPQIGDVVSSGTSSLPCVDSTISYPGKFLPNSTCTMAIDPPKCNSMNPPSFHNVPVAPRNIVSSLSFNSNLPSKSPAATKPAPRTEYTTSAVSFSTQSDSPFTPIVPAPSTASLVIPKDTGNGDVNDKNSSDSSKFHTTSQTSESGPNSFPQSNLSSFEVENRSLLSDSIGAEGMMEVHANSPVLNEDGDYSTKIDSIPQSPAQARDSHRSTFQIDSAMISPELSIQNPNLGAQSGNSGSLDYTNADTFDATYQKIMTKQIFLDDESKSFDDKLLNLTCLLCIEHANLLAFEDLSLRFIDEIDQLDADIAALL